MQKYKRHKWGDGRRDNTVCAVCGCIKKRGMYSVEYILDGKYFDKSPECIKKNDKK